MPTPRKGDLRRTIPKAWRLSTRFWNRSGPGLPLSRGQLTSWGLEAPDSREPQLDSSRDVRFLIESPATGLVIEVKFGAEKPTLKRLRISASVQK